MCERRELRVTGHDILNIPNHIIDEFGGDIGRCSERRDLRLQEIQLISDVLSMDETYSRISCAVEIVQGSAVDQALKLRLDSRDLTEEQLLVLRGDTSFGFIGY